MSIVVERVEIALPRLPPAFDRLTIAVASDLHGRLFRGSKAAAVRLVGTINDLQPDLALLLGDMVHNPNHGPAFLPLLTGLRAGSGAYAALGNHEHAFVWYNRYLGEGRHPSNEEWRRIYAGAGIELLVNEPRPLARGGVRIWLVGVDDPFSGHHDLDAALAEIPTGECSIAFTHSPDLLDYPRAGELDLLLAGHTHGGQVCLPRVGALYAPCRRPRQRAAGLLQGERTRVYVTRGLGEGFPLRLVCPRELTLMTLRSGSA